jgi:signal transduction protein with GAF and PtsI domain
LLRQKERLLNVFKPSEPFKEQEAAAIQAIALLLEDMVASVKALSPMKGTIRIAARWYTVGHRANSMDPEGISVGEVVVGLDDRDSIVNAVAEIYDETIRYPWSRHKKLVGLGFQFGNHQLGKLYLLRKTEILGANWH